MGVSTAGIVMKRSRPTKWSDEILIPVVGVSTSSDCPFDERAETRQKSYWFTMQFPVGSLVTAKSV